MTHAIMETRIVHDGWGRMMVATIRLPDGQVIRREIEDHGKAVAVLPYDPVRKVALLVSQFRPPVFLVNEQEELLEIIAGGLEDESPEDGVRREAMEEGGLALKALEPIADLWTMPGISTERMALFLASYSESDRVGEGGGLADEHEGITIVELPLRELADMADSGRLVDMKTFLLVQTLRLKQPQLFT